MVNTNNKLRIAVLMGGLSSERAISLSTGRMILDSLDRSKYEVEAIDAAMIPGGRRHPEPGSGRNIEAVAEAERAIQQKYGGLKSMERLMSNGCECIDAAFIALHGRFGEDGTIQGMLELLGIPYTGSGVLASALAMDKIACKRVLKSAGVSVPDSIDLLTRAECQNPEIIAQAESLGYPLMVKPSRQGSTIGMSKVTSAGDLIAAVEEALKYDSQVLIERFVPGTEITVGVLGNRRPEPLPIIEIVPAKGFYDYEAKYNPGATEEIIPARISKAAEDKAIEAAIRSHKAIGCRGMSRVDLIVKTDDEVVVLEVNTIPGMTPTSLLPTAAKAAGIDFPELLDRLIKYALEDE